MSGTAVDDNDPRFTYKSTWVSGGLTEEFDGTHHSTDIPGAQVVFGPFSGTSISVFGTIGGSQPTVHYFVDSDQQNLDEKVPSDQTPQFRQLLYQASNLDPSTTHTLQINQLDSGSFTLDFVEIGGSSSSSSPTSILVSSSPPSTTTTSPTSSNVTTNPVVPVTSVPSFPSTQVTQGPPTAKVTSIGATTARSTANSSMASESSTSGQAEPSTSSQSSPFTSNRTFIAVISSVVGVCVLILCIAVVLILSARRRRSKAPRRGGNSTTSFPVDRHPSLTRNRPSLRLLTSDIPALLRDPTSSSSILPVYSNPVASTSADLPSTTKQGLQEDSENPSQEDSNSVPVFDIKRRPVSGTTMTTRVTVGTNIGSIPDEPPPPERLPALPDFPPELVLTGLSLAPSTGSDSLSNTLSWSNFSFDAVGTNATGISAATSHTSWTYPRRPSSPVPPLPRLPTSPKPLVHADAGVRLDANLPSTSPLRIDLPPPYQHFS